MTHGARATRCRHKRRPLRLRVPVPNLGVPLVAPCWTHVEEMGPPQRTPAPRIETPELAAPPTAMDVGLEAIARDNAKLERIEAPMPTLAAVPAFDGPRLASESSTAPIRDAPRTTRGAGMLAWFSDVELGELAPPPRVADSPSMARRLATGMDAPSLNSAVGVATLLIARELEHFHEATRIPTSVPHEPDAPIPMSGIEPFSVALPRRAPVLPSTIPRLAAPFTIPMPTRSESGIDNLLAPTVEPTRRPELDAPHLAPARGLRGWVSGLWGAIAGRVRALDAPNMRRRYVRGRARVQDAITRALAAWQPSRAREQFRGEFLRGCLRDLETVRRDRARYRQQAEQRKLDEEIRQYEAAARERERQQRSQPQSSRKRGGRGWSRWG